MNPLNVDILREPTHPGKWLVLPVDTIRLFRTGADFEHAFLHAYVADVRDGKYGLEYVPEGSGNVRMAESNYGQMHYWIDLELVNVELQKYLAGELIQ